MHVLILAGGFATRLWPLTEKKAKPLIPVAGKPLLCFLIEGIPEEYSITISTNQVFADDFYSFKSEYFPNRNIQIFVEDSIGETKKKGALAAVALFLETSKIQEDLMLLAGDNYFGFAMKKFIAAFSGFPILAAYDIRDKKEATKFGVVVPFDDAFVKAFEEKPENPSSTLVSTGAYIFPFSSFEHIIFYSKSHADDLGGIFEYFSSKKIAIQYFSFDEIWYDIGSFSAFMEANEKLLSSSIVSEKAFLNGIINIEGKCIIEKKCILENVDLENSIILEGVSLKNVSLKNCLVCENCIIENIDMSGKMIRSESVVIR